MIETFSRAAVYFWFISPLPAGLCYFVLTYGFIMYWYCMCVYPYHFFVSLAKGLCFWALCGGESRLDKQVQCMWPAVQLLWMSGAIPPLWSPLLALLLNGMRHMRCKGDVKDLIQALLEGTNQRGISHNRNPWLLHMPLHQISPHNFQSLVCNLFSTGLSGCVWVMIVASPLCFSNSLLLQTAPFQSEIMGENKALYFTTDLLKNGAALPQETTEKINQFNSVAGHNISTRK